MAEPLSRWQLAVCSGSALFLAAVLALPELSSSATDAASSSSGTQLPRLQALARAAPGWVVITTVWGIGVSAPTVT